MNTFQLVIQNLLPYIIGAIIGAIIGVIGSFGSGFVKEYFDNRDRKAKHKRNVAREVHKLHIEASTDSYRKPPRNREHVNSVLVDVRGIDKKMSTVLDRFITLWNLLTGELQKDKRNASQKEYEYFKGLLDEIEQKRNILEEWESKLRTR